MMKQLLVFLTLVLIVSVPCSQYLSAQQESAQKTAEPDTTLKTLDDFEESETETEMVRERVDEAEKASEKEVEQRDSMEPSALESITQNRELVRVRFKSLFPDADAIERLLGAEPRFVYDPKNAPDPMLIPWIRADKEANKLLDEAAMKITSQDYEAALEIYMKVIKRFPYTSWAQKASDKIRDLGNLRDAQDPPGEIIVLPASIRESLKGILFDEIKPLVIVDENILGIGDTVPNTEATIKKIEKQKVTFNYRGKDFTERLSGD